MVDFWENSEPYDCFAISVKRKKAFIKSLEKERKRLGFEIIDETGVV